MLIITSLEIRSPILFFNRQFSTESSFLEIQIHIIKSIRHQTMLFFIYIAFRGPGAGHGWSSTALVQFGLRPTLPDVHLHSAHGPVHAAPLHAPAPQPALQDVHAQSGEHRRADSTATEGGLLGAGEELAPDLYGTNHPSYPQRGRPLQQERSFDCKWIFWKASYLRASSMCFYFQPLKKLAWYTERSVSEISLGGLLVLIIIRKSLNERDSFASD